MIEALFPLHPRAVHFPIALTLAGILFTWFGLARQDERWRWFGQTNLFLGWLGVMAAVITGLIDQSRAQADAQVTAIINQHITVGLGLLIALGVALYWPVRNRKLWYDPNARLGYIVLLVVVVALVLLEAWIGGKLVFIHGVGVQ